MDTSVSHPPTKSQIILTIQALEHEIRAINIAIMVQTQRQEMAKHALSRLKALLKATA